MSQLVYWPAQVSARGVGIFIRCVCKLNNVYVDQPHAAVVEIVASAAVAPAVNAWLWHTRVASLLGCRDVN